MYFGVNSKQEVSIQKRCYVIDPKTSYIKAGGTGFYEGGKQEYDRLEKAAGLSDEDAVHDAAYASASYGAFQIMGFHYKLVGYSTVDSFVSDLYTHERKHLKAFGLFCKANKLIRHLQTKNWASFAKGYNGSGYKKNKYDTKLASAYTRYNAIE
jgi:hypothetical protein